MKVSTKGRYGLRLMIELALAYGKRLLSLKEIARNQGLSEKYLEQIITPLGRSGLVNSVRGAQGGYSLGRPPEEISVGDILRAAEGELLAVGCIDGSCERESACLANMAWRSIRDAMEQTADRISLADLTKEAPPCHQPFQRS